MQEINIINGRDINILIDGKILFQAESVEIRNTADIHKVRSCFKGDDIVHIKNKNEYKITLINLKFKKPFENCNFYDLDNFTVTVRYDDTRINFENCIWSDFLITTDKNKFRERVYITALKMNMEEVS